MKKRPPRPDSDATYRVGYGKPPSEHQFQPGRSGNRKGRPKGAKSTAALLREILDRKVEIRIRGKVRKVSVREAMLTRFADSALQGDIKAAGFLLPRYDLSDTASDATDTVLQDEQEILKEFLEERMSKGDPK